MSFAVYIVFTTLVLNGAHSYILLTANLDDVHSILKDIVDSPMSDQIGNIVRRAYTQFGHNRVQEYLKRSGGFHMRADETADGSAETGKRQAKSRGVAHASSHLEPRITQRQENYRRKLDSGDSGTLGSGMNEADYIRSINKVFDNV